MRKRALQISEMKKRDQAYDNKKAPSNGNLIGHAPEASKMKIPNRNISNHITPSLSKILKLDF